ncbi:MAG: protoporphyrinogen oxidase [Terriglobales bacterium]|jgi:oxygen-dependent protoporphyrinogen oxidase
MPRIAIIGGGISGLSAAFTLEEKRRGGAPVEYVLFESSPRLGGVMVTDRVDGCLVEAGPDSFLTEKPWAANLCRKIGLGGQLIGSNDSERKTYIVVKNRLVVMPDGLMFMVPTKIMPIVFSPLFSLRTKIRMAAEWFHPPRKASADETVAAMVERHYGREMVDRLADPLLSGVYGGEASELSVRAALARFAEMEAKYGSLGRAMLAARKKMAGVNRPAPPLFTSLKDGMQQMVDALAAHLDSSALRTSAPVQSVVADEDGWSVSSGSQIAHFDALIVATPAPAASRLLQLADENLARELREIRYSSSVTVALGYDETVRRSLPPGFGFLVPRSEGRRMLAATFVHNKFPHRAPENRALVRCFFGGAHAEEILDRSENQILEILRDELRQIIGLNAEPLFARVYKWKSAMAQYSVGHLDRLQRIESLRRKLPRLALAGNGYSGIGVPDCVRSGSEAAGKILAEMGMPPAA